MPVYKFKCEKCNLEIEEVLPISKRDELGEISTKYCPVMIKRFYEQLESVSKGKATYIHGGMFISDPINKCRNSIECGLKRVPTSGSFKI